MSVRPSPLKSPVSRLTSRREDQAAKSPIKVFVTVKLPSPFENAIGSVFQPTGPVSATSVLPSPLKSPVSFTARRSDAQAAKSPTNELDTVKPPLPLEKATGKVFQPAGPVSATSVLPSPLKSPVNFAEGG